MIQFCIYSSFSQFAISTTHKYPANKSALNLQFLVSRLKQLIKDVCIQEALHSNEAIFALTPFCFIKTVRQGAKLAEHLCFNCFLIQVQQSLQGESERVLFDSIVTGIITFIPGLLNIYDKNSQNMLLRSEDNWFEQCL